VDEPADASAFLGHWKITNMNVWSQDYVDLIVPGFIEFRLEDRHVMGSFQFGCFIRRLTIFRASTDIGRRIRPAPIQ